jgi:hypothetical protein
MPSIHTEIQIEACAEKVWAAVRNVGAVHQHLVPGLVTDVRLEGDARLVTFANGKIVRELIVDINDQTRRLAYAAVGGTAQHHNSSMQVFAGNENNCRLVWITDFMPSEASATIGALIEKGAAIIKRTLEQDNG